MSVEDTSQLGRSCKPVKSSRYQKSRTYGLIAILTCFMGRRTGLKVKNGLSRCNRFTEHNTTNTNFIIAV